MSKMPTSKMPDSKMLAGRVALVTGGSRGLGAAVARALADQGADVAISYVASADKAAAVVADLKAQGVRAAAFRSDQADTAAAAPLIGRVMAEFGRLDILVNNAAISVLGQMVDDPAADTARLVRTLVIVFVVICSIRIRTPKFGCYCMYA